MARPSTSEEASARRNLSPDEVDVLLAKLRAPGEEALTEEDRRKLLGIVETWAHLIEVAAVPSTDMPRIRQLLGLPRSRGAVKETTAPAATPAAAPNGNAGQRGGADGSGPPGSASVPDGKRTQKNRDAHGRRGAKDFGKLVQAYHAHSALHAGDSCPQACGGRVYKYRPSEFTTISGQSPLLATRHTVETLQCNLCKATYKAPLPEELVADGVLERVLYSYSAVAIVSSHRFFAGLPMHRQDQMQQALGIAVPDASIWDMCERQADTLRPIWRVLNALAGNAVLFYGDDTGATILESRVKVRNNRRTGVPELRTGCHTTCVIAITPDGEAISLFVTGIHHTGEVMDLVVAERERTLPPPIFMGDCIASNTVTQTTVLYAGCNSHAVRRFKELAPSYPQETDFVLSRYKRIFENDELCKAQQLTAEARRDYHRAHSKPLLREICEHGHELIEQRKVEPNSDLGQAFDYVIDNEHRLSAFARHPHAPLCNNRCERQLRLCVRLRETAHFFKNLIGAAVADIILTVGATALSSQQNLFDYFVAVQRYAHDVREYPHLWVPWQYQARIQDLTHARPGFPRGPEPPALVVAP